MFRVFLVLHINRFRRKLYPPVHKKKPHVLVCPLNWGIGHATRTVPLIRAFMTEGASVTLAGEGHTLSFLRKAFPGSEHILFNGIRILYPSGSNMPLSMLRQLPRIITSIAAENRRLKKIIRELDIDIVISDNRFGLWNHQVSTVYITHQINIRSPLRWKWTEPVLRYVHRMIIEKYDHCWIPDHEGPDNLSGKLSHDIPLPSNATYTGPLSRFAGRVHDDSPDDLYDLAILLSGPEPQRTLLEDKVIRQLSGSGKKAFLFRGTPGSDGIPGAPDNVTIVPHGSDDLIREVLQSARMVICRSGYSTIMDLVALQKKALLVPTPGQTEQEYLARYMKDKGWFDFVSQEDLDIRDMDAGTHTFGPPADFFDLSLPGAIIRKLLQGHGS